MEEFSLERGSRTTLQDMYKFLDIRYRFVMKLSLRLARGFYLFFLLEKCFVKITFQVLISLFNKFSLLLEVALYCSIFPSISDFILSSSSFFSRRCWIFSDYRSKLKWDNDKSSDKHGGDDDDDDDENDYWIIIKDLDALKLN